MTPTKRRATRLALLLALLPALGTGAAAADELLLPGLPPGPPPEHCRPIGPAEAAGPALRLSGTFRDDFSDFDPYAGPWTPHYAHNDGRDWRARTLVANHELQLYVDPLYGGLGTSPLGLDPFAPGDGRLALVARPTPRLLLPPLRGFPYVSGMIASHQSFTQRHGYFELTARLPDGTGLWPAFWLLAPGGWPPEIDAMEARGEPGYAVHVHWSEDGAHRSSGCDIPLADGPSAFHGYGVLWTPEAIAFYLDRTPVAWIATPPGYDQPMYMIANLAVGGWAGEPDRRTSFPGRYVLDRIAAWSLAGAGE